MTLYPSSQYSCESVPFNSVCEVQWKTKSKPIFIILPVQKSVGRWVYKRPRIFTKSSVSTNSECTTICTTLTVVSPGQSSPSVQQSISSISVAQHNRKNNLLYYIVTNVSLHRHLASAFHNIRAITINSEVLFRKQVWANWKMEWCIL